MKKRVRDKDSYYNEDRGINNLKKYDTKFLILLFSLIFIPLSLIFAYFTWSSGRPLVTALIIPAIGIIFLLYAVYMRKNYEIYSKTIKDKKLIKEKIFESKSSGGLYLAIGFLLILIIFTSAYQRFYYITIFLIILAVLVFIFKKNITSMEIKLRDKGYYGQAYLAALILTFSSILPINIYLRLMILILVIAYIIYLIIKSYKK